MTEKNILAGQREATGHVYLIAPLNPHKDWIKGIGTWPFKIGVSKTIRGIEKRLSNLSTGNWVDLKIVTLSSKIIHPYDVELYLHTNYSNKKIRGEWFNLSYDEFNYIEDLLENEPLAKFSSMRDAGKFIREWGDCGGYVV